MIFCVTQKKENWNNIMVCKYHFWIKNSFIALLTQQLNISSSSIFNPPLDIYLDYYHAFDFILEVICLSLYLLGG